MNSNTRAEIKMLCCYGVGFLCGWYSHVYHLRWFK